MFNEKTSSNITDVRNYGHLGLIVKKSEGEVWCNRLFYLCLYISASRCVKKTGLV